MKLGQWLILAKQMWCTYMGHFDLQFKVDTPLLMIPNITFNVCDLCNQDTSFRQHISFLNQIERCHNTSFTNCFKIFITAYF
jgi:hypothetical protein